LADTAEVLARIDRRGSKSKLLVIVANERGAEEAVKQTSVTYLGYPFSISETFQQRNTNTGIEGSWERTARIAELARANGKELVVYISMAFGNPYGDAWSPEVALHWVGPSGEGAGCGHHSAQRHGGCGPACGHHGHVLCPDPSATAR
jgi:hydroxymethylglutaryl-CoA lyase